MCWRVWDEECCHSHAFVQVKAGMLSQGFSSPTPSLCLSQLLCAGCLSHAGCCTFKRMNLAFLGGLQVPWKKHRRCAAQAGFTFTHCQLLPRHLWGFVL